MIYSCSTPPLPLPPYAPAGTSYSAAWPALALHKIPFLQSIKATAAPTRSTPYPTTPLACSFIELHKFNPQLPLQLPQPLRHCPAIDIGVHFNRN